MGKGCDPGAGRARRRASTARVCFWRGGRCGTPSPVGPGRWRRVSNKLTEIQYVIDVREMPGEGQLVGQEPGTTRAAGVGRSGSVGRRLLRAFQLSGSDRNSDPACGVCATHVSSWPVCRGAAARARSF